MAPTAKHGASQAYRTKSSRSALDAREAVGLFIGRPPGPRTSWSRLAWPLAALTWTIAIGVATLLVKAAITHVPHMSDLAVYRTAGHQVLDGKAVYARVPPSQLRSLGRSYLVFTYPPFAAILAVPLALMPWRVAELAWAALAYLALVITIWFAFRPLLIRTARFLPAALGAIVASCVFLLPMLQQIKYGQVDIVLAALCVADLAAVRQAPGRRACGLLIGVATAIKLTPGLFIIYLLLTGRRRAAALAAAVAVGCAAMAWAVLPGGSGYYWANALFNTDRLGRPSQTSDQSIKAMLLRAFAPGPLPAALWLVLAAAVAVAGLVAARVAARRGNEMAGVAIVGLLAVLISPVSWIHHMVWIVVAIGAILGDGHGTWRWPAALITADFFIFADPYSTTRPWLAQYAPHLYEQVRHDTFGIACAAVIIVLAAIPATASDAAKADNSR